MYSHTRQEIGISEAKTVYSRMCLISFDSGFGFYWHTCSQLVCHGLHAVEIGLVHVS